jgi:hypothetical protein
MSIKETLFGKLPKQAVGREGLSRRNLIKLVVPAFLVGACGAPLPESQEGGLDEPIEPTAALPVFQEEPGPAVTATVTPVEALATPAMVQVDGEAGLAGSVGGEEQEPYGERLGLQTFTPAEINQALARALEAGIPLGPLTDPGSQNTVFIQGGGVACRRFPPGIYIDTFPANLPERDLDEAEAAVGGVNINVSENEDSVIFYNPFIPESNFPSGVSPIGTCIVRTTNLNTPASEVYGLVWLSLADNELIASYTPYQPDSYFYEYELTGRWSTYTSEEQRQLKLMAEISGSYDFGDQGEISKEPIGNGQLESKTISADENSYSLTWLKNNKGVYILNTSLLQIDISSSLVLLPADAVWDDELQTLSWFEDSTQFYWDVESGTIKKVPSIEMTSRELSKDLITGYITGLNYKDEAALVKDYTGRFFTITEGEKEVLVVLTQDTVDSIQAELGVDAVGPEEIAAHLSGLDSVWGQMLSRLKAEEALVSDSDINQNKVILGVDEGLGPYLLAVESSKDHNNFNPPHAKPSAKLIWLAESGELEDERIDFQTEHFLYIRLTPDGRIIRDTGFQEWSELDLSSQTWKVYEPEDRPYILGDSAERLRFVAEYINDSGHVFLNYDNKRYDFSMDLSQDGSYLITAGPFSLIIPMGEGPNSLTAGQAQRLKTVVDYLYTHNSYLVESVLPIAHIHYIAVYPGLNNTYGAFANPTRYKNGIRGINIDPYYFDDRFWQEKGFKNEVKDAIMGCQMYTLIHEICRHYVRMKNPGAIMEKLDIQTRDLQAEVLRNTNFRTEDDKEGAWARHQHFIDYINHKY